MYYVGFQLLEKVIKIKFYVISIRSDYHYIHAV